MCKSLVILSGAPRRGAKREDLWTRSVQLVRLSADALKDSSAALRSARNDRAGRCPSARNDKARGILSIMLSLMLALSLMGCKPTDFFTEVVITPFSDVVDYNNPTKAIVNSPDATEESAALTALAWTDESPQSVETENLVTYSAEPTTTLVAHHSIFDLDPRFPGIFASDTVRLFFAPTSELDHETEADEQDQSAPEALSQSTGGDENQESGGITPLESATVGEARGEGAAGEEVGGSDELGDDPGGNAPGQNTPGTGDGPGDNPEGPGEDPYGGYNGEVAVYNPNDGFARVNRVEHLATLGGDVAVMAQSIGGAGAICAMNEYAYRGLDAQGQRTLTYASFSDVFYGELPSDFEQSGLLWAGNGATPESVKDIDALTASCGQGGVIIYDQRMGTAETLFDLDQRRRLQASEIQLVPVDMSTVQGMLDAAQVMGEALSESTECAQDASAMAREYINTVNGIVRSVAATNGGYLGTHRVRTDLLTAYNSPPVSSFRWARVYGYFATDSESGLYHRNSHLDVSDIVLFANNGTIGETPLSFWMQAAGVWDGTVVSGAHTGLRILWFTPAIWPSGTLGGGHSGGALSRWLDTPALGGEDTYRSSPMTGYTDDLDSAYMGSSWGLGSSQVPYLIVCASDGKTAPQIKSTVVQSMLSYDQRGVMTPYSVLPYDNYLVPNASGDGFSFSSTIGLTNSTTSENPFYMGLAVDDVVRENPTGLLGNWTKGNMESVLEAIWLADIYSSSPAGCDYAPVTNMRNFSVTIGGVRCTTTRDAVLQFYTTFYRCDASGVYGAIVTDEGL